MLESLVVVFVNINIVFAHIIVIGSVVFVDVGYGGFEISIRSLPVYR